VTNDFIKTYPPLAVMCEVIAKCDLLEEYGLAGITPKEILDYSKTGEIDLFAMYTVAKYRQRVVRDGKS